MFEDYIEQLAQKPKEPDPVYYYSSMGSNITLNPYILEDKLSKVELLGSDEIYSIVLHYYPMILNKKFIDSNKITIAKAFTNERFVITFSQAISSGNPLTPDQRVNCNRLIYDYMMFKNKDSNILMVLYNLGKNINRDTINILMSLGLSESLCTDLAISRYSTSDLVVAMKRLNIVIINSSLNIMTEQTIINIYEKLFDNLTPMFEGIMFDAWDEDDFNDQEQEEIYGTITLAILDILKEAPIDHIRTVITMYSQDHQYLYPNNPVRINLRAIAVSDYRRIIDAVDYVENVMMVHVPSNTQF